MPGLSNCARFTAAMFTPTPGLNQQVGLGTLECDIAFQLAGTVMGVQRATGGRSEVVVFQIPVGSLTSATWTITLPNYPNGQLTATVAASTSVAYTVNQLVHFPTFTVGGSGSTWASNSWNVFTNNLPDYVVLTFSSQNAAVLSGNASIISSSGMPTGTTVSTLTKGAFKTREFVEQARWNIDTMDGSGNDANGSGALFVPTAGNVYQITYAWLGFGAIIMSIMDAATGLFQPVHRFLIAGTSSEPSVDQPSMAFTAAINYAASVPASTLALRAALRLVSVGLFIQGPYLPRDPKFAVTATVALSTVANAQVVGLMLRMPVSYNGLNNQAEAILTSIGIASNLSFGGSGSPITTLNLILNPYILRTTVGPKWTYVTGAARTPYLLPSPMQSATADTNGATLATSMVFSGGSLLRSIPIAANTGTSIDLTSFNITLQAEDILIFQLSNDETTTGAPSAKVSVTWVEIH